MKGVWTTLTAAVAALVVLGCQPSGGEATKEPAGDKKLRIAVIPKGSTHEFWKSVQAGAVAAGEELGVEIIWKGPLKEDDREDQIKVVEDFVTQGVDGIVLAPLDDTALRIPVTQAQDAGIPVLIIDSALKDVETVSFVATDNFEAGKSAGKRMLELMGEGGKLLVLRYQEGSASTNEREEGFLEVVRGVSKVEIVSDNQYAGATTATAQAASERLIERFRSGNGVSFDAVYCPNESSTFGMLRALQDAGVAGKVKFVGFDSSTKLVEALEAGQIDALVVQNPFMMGKAGVEYMVKHLKKESVDKRLDTGAKVVDKANMTDPEIARLIGR